MFIILVGILIFLNNFNWIDYNLIMKFLWPSVVIIIGIVGMIERKKFDFIFSAIILFGLNHLLINLNITDKNIVDLIFWPLILVILGYNLLFQGHVKGNNNLRYYTVIFSGLEEKNDDKEFTECDIMTIFGGGDFDFSHINLKGSKGYINIISIFGGAELKLPTEYKVSSSGIPILGGFENKLSTNNEKAKKELIINYTVILGGISIKN